MCAGCNARIQHSDQAERKRGSKYSREAIRGRSVESAKKKRVLIVVEVRLLSVRGLKRSAQWVGVRKGVLKKRCEDGRGKGGKGGKRTEKVRNTVMVLSYPDTLAGKLWGQRVGGGWRDQRKLGLLHIEE